MNSLRLYWISLFMVAFIALVGGCATPPALFVGLGTPEAIATAEATVDAPAPVPALAEEPAVAGVEEATAIQQRNTQISPQGVQESGPVSDDAQEQLALGIAAMEMGDINLALTYLDQALALQPNLAEAIHYRAVPFLYGRNMTVLLDKEWRELEPIIQVWDWYGDAQPNLEALIGQRPDEPALYLLRALIQIVSGISNPDQFEADLERARQLNPESPLPYELEAIQLLAADDAFGPFEVSVEMPDWSQIEILLQEARQRGGRLADAIFLRGILWHAYSWHGDVLWFAQPPFSDHTDAAEFLSLTMKSGFWQQDHTVRSRQLMEAVDPILAGLLVPHIERLDTDPDYSIGYAVRGFANYYAGDLLDSLAWMLQLDALPALSPLQRAIESNDGNGMLTDLNTLTELSYAEGVFTYLGAELLRQTLPRQASANGMAEETVQSLLEAIETLQVALADQISEESQENPVFVRDGLTRVMTELVAMNSGEPYPGFYAQAISDWKEYHHQTSSVSPVWNSERFGPTEILEDLTLIFRQQWSKEFYLLPAAAVNLIGTATYEKRDFLETIASEAE